MGESAQKAMARPGGGATCLPPLHGAGGAGRCHPHRRWRGDQKSVITVIRNDRGAPHEPVVVVAER
jgi:hypothetical protein